MLELGYRPKPSPAPGSTEAGREPSAVRRHLSAHHRDTLEAFQILATRIERETDCKQCANCCRFMEVRVADEEIAALAAHLGMSPLEVRQWYTEADPEDPAQRILRNEHDACVFLDDKLCIVYDLRRARAASFRMYTSVRTPSARAGNQSATTRRFARFFTMPWRSISTCRIPRRTRLRRPLERRGPRAKKRSG